MILYILRHIATAEKRKRCNIHKVPCSRFHSPTHPINNDPPNQFRKSKFSNPISPISMPWQSPQTSRSGT
jgi:hypothetical protein